MNKKNYEDFEKELIKIHTKPIARIDLVEIVNKFANSCIDVSDGLVADLNHTLEKNNYGVILENLPIHPLLKKYCEKYNKNLLDYILYGGEDYQLLFSVSPFNVKYIPDNLFKIGRIIENKGIFFKDRNSLYSLKIKGFSHL
jgi:thiamine-monophosphate kinase